MRIPAKPSVEAVAWLIAHYPSTDDRDEMISRAKAIIEHVNDICANVPIAALSDDGDICITYRAHGVTVDVMRDGDVDWFCKSGTLEATLVELRAPVLFNADTDKLFAKGIVP